MKTMTYRFVYEWRYAAPVTGAGILISLAALNYFAGAWDPENAPWYFDSGEAFIGMTLLVTLVPAYLGLAAIYSFRRSMEIAREADLIHGTNLDQLVRTIPWKLVSLAAITGILFAIFLNIPADGWLNFILETPTDKVIAFGQVLIWTVVFVFIAIRLRIVLGFNQASQGVAIDIFEPANLRPFARIGLVDVLTFAGGLALSTVQSLDFSFRPDNYINAVSVIGPVMLFLAICPMWGVHKRMGAIKKEQLMELNNRISRIPKDLQPDNMSKLEILLQRRERVTNCGTWPIDIAILQRFLFYIIIPPLAWIGAALVESVIEGLLGSG